MNRYFKYIIFFLLISSFGFSQNKKAKLQAENKKLRTEISQLNTQLASNKKKSISIEESLKLLDKKIEVRNQLISNIAEERDLLQKNIVSQQQQISTLNNEVTLLTNKYKAVLQTAYKKRTLTQSGLFLMSSTNFSQMYQRYRYVQKYKQQRKRQVEEINTKKQLIQNKITSLAKDKKQKDILIAQQQREKFEIDSDKKEQAVLLGKINSENNVLASQIQEKEKQSRAIQAQIEAIIREEIRLAAEKARKEEEDKAAAALAVKKSKPDEKINSKTKLSTTSKESVKNIAKNNKTAGSSINKVSKEDKSNEDNRAEVKESAKSVAPTLTTESRELASSFASNKGRLPAPVSGSVVQGFGRQAYPGMKEVYVDNAGINISSSAGASVQSVFKGEVSSVIIIPGGNKAVIIRHGNYFTVYNNLAQVYVSKGQNVSTGQSIGSVYTDPNTGKSILNFQIWQNTTKLNPSSWIGK